MKGPETMLWVVTVDDPSDPESSLVGTHWTIGTPQGVPYSALIGTDAFAITSGDVSSQIDATNAWALDARAVAYAPRWDDVNLNPVNIACADFGELFLDINLVERFFGLLTNSAVYGYDFDAADGSMSAVWAGPFNITLDVAGYAIQTHAVAYAMGLVGPSRLNAGAGAYVAQASSASALLVQPPGEWSITHAPAADTQATVTRGAPGAGSYNVIKSISADLTAVAAIAAPLTLVVRDGASGAGAIIWNRRLTSPAGETKSVELTGLNIVGSDDTALTVEFTAAPGATNFETISVTGITAGS